jgi:hypothetical protein
MTGSSAIGPDYINQAQRQGRPRDIEHHKKESRVRVNGGHGGEH